MDNGTKLMASFELPTSAACSLQCRAFCCDLLRGVYHYCSQRRACE